MSIDKHSKVWEGVYDSFSQVDSSQNNVFEGSIWLEKAIARAKQLLIESSYEDSISSNAITHDYALPYVVAMYASKKSKLKILDFGGGVGTSYIPLLSIVDKKISINFDVVENKILCEAGNEIFSNDNRINFFEHIPEKKQYNIIHAGSSIHYIDDWIGLIEKFNECKAKYIIFSDLPVGDIKTFVTVQWFHGNKIPVRFWNFQEFVENIEKHSFELIFKSKYRGYYLDKNGELPTLDFDKSHRLDSFCQLIFKKI